MGQTSVRRLGRGKECSEECTMNEREEELDGLSMGDVDVGGKPRKRRHARTDVCSLASHGFAGVQPAHHNPWMAPLPVRLASGWLELKPIGAGR